MVALAEGVRYNPDLFVHLPNSGRLVGNLNKLVAYSSEPFFDYARKNFRLLSDTTDRIIAIGSRVNVHANSTRDNFSFYTEYDNGKDRFDLTIKTDKGRNRMEGIEVSRNVYEKDAEYSTAANCLSLRFTEDEIHLEQLISPIPLGIDSKPRDTQVFRLDIYPRSLRIEFALVLGGKEHAIFVITPSGETISLPDGWKLTNFFDGKRKLWVKDKIIDFPHADELAAREIERAIASLEYSFKLQY